MKKIFAIVLSAVLAVLLVGALAGCGENSVLLGSDAGIVLNKKFIHQDYLQDPQEEQIYYIFTSADKGEYHSYKKTLTSVSAYTIYFRYRIVEETLFCFYDSVEYEPVHTGSDVSTDWSMNIDVFCDDFLVYISSGAYGDNIYYYFNEDYLDKIPNFDI